MGILYYTTLCGGVFPRRFFGIMVKHVDSQLSAKKPINIPTQNNSTYEEAIYALNGLQSNAAVLEKSRRERSSSAYKNIDLTLKYLEKLGINTDNINKLNVIHVSGTKGKGSTCAFAECILRHHGVKTGFYSSPHLVAARERIRINGQPLSKEMFAYYFWEVYNCLISKKENVEDMPHYFKFLTVMAFHVFLKEKVDVTVLEVGVGGLYDCTNVVQSPFVVGVTSLGLDHVRILGDTIDKIAWQKAGIFKPGVSAFTVPQPEGAMPVLQKKAEEVGCSLHIAPPLESYKKDDSPLLLGVPGEVQRINASLALQLCHTWLHHFNLQNPELFQESRSHHSYGISPPLSPPFPITTEFLKGLENCAWPGRFQTLVKGNITYYLDGAHTSSSMELCAKWFEEASRNEESRIKGTICKVLLFNSTGERKSEGLLLPLSEQNFSLALFSPNKVKVVKDATSDQSNFTVDPEKEMEQCELNMHVWSYFMSSRDEVTALSSQNGSIPPIPNTQDQINSSSGISMVFPCLFDVIQWLSHAKDLQLIQNCPMEYQFDFPKVLLEATHVQVLVTGSLHLVGGVLSVIVPDF